MDEPQQKLKLKTLRQLIRHGKLFEIQDWIRKGEPLFFPEANQQQAISLAVTTGFHSMVETLAKNWSHQDSLNEAYCNAVFNRRVDLAYLLLNHSADMWVVDLESVARCYNREFMQYYLDRFYQSDQKMKLYQVITARVQYLIGSIRDFAPTYPDYHKELAQAMIYFVDNNDAKWVSLTKWLGADPRLRVPDPRWSNDDEDDPDSWSTAMECAVHSGTIEVLKILKPSAAMDNLNSLLAHFWLGPNGNFHVVDYLLELGADINNLPDHGSTALSELLCKWNWSPWDRRSTLSYFDVRDIEKLVKKGARYVPSSRYDLRRVRENICNMDRVDALRLIKILAKATDLDSFQKLIGTPKMREKMEMAPKLLLEKLRLIPKQSVKKHSFK